MNLEDIEAVGCVFEVGRCQRTDGAVHQRVQEVTDHLEMKGSG